MSVPLEKGPSMLTVRDLVKIYPGPVAALQGVDLDIPNGMFGLLGSNGAGKTTLMRILAGLLEPTSGKAALDGESILDRPEIIRGIDHRRIVSATDLRSRAVRDPGVPGRGQQPGSGFPTPPFARAEVSRDAPTVVNWQTCGRRGRAGQETLPEPDPARTSEDQSRIRAQHSRENFEWLNRRFPDSPPQANLFTPGTGTGGTGFGPNV